jgi:acyl-CoA reductase-like NAD-dependent aldehyde dehydrogenase
VNAVGDIIDPATGKVIAGVRTVDAGARRRAVAAALGRVRRRPGENTTPRRRHQRHAVEGAGATVA